MLELQSLIFLMKLTSLFWKKNLKGSNNRKVVKFLFEDEIKVHSMIRHDILKNLKRVSITIWFLLCYLLSVLRSTKQLML